MDALGGLEATDKDVRTALLMARVLDDALATANLTLIGLSEDDWSEMAEVVADAVAGGLRDAALLQRLALNALEARREILCRDAFASSMTLAAGAELAGFDSAGGGRTT